MVFGIVIAHICWAGPPVESELLLIFPIAEPVEPHIHRFRALGLDSIVDDAFGRGVICLNGSGRLFVAHLF